MSAPFAKDDVPLGMCQTTTLMPKLPFQRIAVSGNSMAPKYNDGLWVEGDNKSESTDSRHWGVVHDHEFRGVVLFRYKRN